MNDTTSKPDSPPTAQRADADRPGHEREPQQQQRESQQQDGQESAGGSGPRAPGGNRLNDIADEDIDKVVPRDGDDTKLRDHTLGDADEPDAAGNLPGPL
ncbi:hypothetical protein [Paraburkholderia sp.]|uniref:hypothetical protein n=1 Tax=Paraburkholderia sp. TaxID=1926495 RepID=UPI002F401153